MTQIPTGKASYGYHYTGTRRHRSEQRDGVGFRHSNVNTECSKCQGTGHNDPACNWNGEDRVNPGVKCHICNKRYMPRLNVLKEKKTNCSQVRGLPAWEFVQTNTTTYYGSTTFINRRSA